MEDRNKIVCLCKHVSAGEIRDAINDGCDSLESIEEKTCAGSQCGACKKHIEKMLLPNDRC